ncbi:MAG TPA: hypothetical protein VNH38_02785 [Candidatus Dormibacteraeota bacterium]|nr:hypothetical protein [Candidatus Dormibacteraeota bacterium]
MAEPSDDPSSDSDPDQQIAWIRTPYRAPVFDTAGGDFGITDSLLGDEASDIFHGLAVKVHQGGHVVEIAAAQIDKITLGGVHTSVSPDQVALLPAYQEERWYHLGQGGLFRKHPEWKER